MCDYEVYETEEMNAACALCKQTKQYILVKDYEKAKENLLELFHTHLKAFAVFEYGKIMLEEGDIYKARLCFNKLVTYGGEYGVYALQKLGELEESLGNKKEAIEYYERSIEKSANVYIINKLIKLYSKYSDADRIKKAYEKMLNTDSRNFALIFLARIEVREKNYGQARAYLTELIETDVYESEDKLIVCEYTIKDKAFALTELGKLEVIYENYDEARKCFDKLILMGGKDKIIGTLELGKLEVTLKNYDEARKHFESLLNTESRNYALIELGKLDIILGNVEEALVYFNELIELGGKDKEFALQEIVKLGREAEDVEILKKALAIADDKTEGKAYTLVKLGNLLLEQGKPEEALEYFLQLKALDFEHVYNTDYYLGRAYDELGNNEEAKKYYLNVVESDKTYRFNALRYLGGIEYKEKNIEKAIEYFEAFIVFTDDNRIMAPLDAPRLEETIFFLGILDASVGNSCKARICFETLINNDFSNKNRAKLELARLEKNLGNIDKAKTILEELLNTDNRAYALLELSLLLIDMKQYDKAKEHLQDLMTYGGKDEIIAKEHLAELEIQLYNLKEAKGLLNSLLDTFDRNFAVTKLGLIADIEGDLDTARVYLEEAIETSEELNTFTILELGRVENKAGNIDRAISLFESLEGTDSENMAKFEIAKIKYNNGNEEEAFLILDKLLDTEVRGAVLLYKARLDAGVGLVNTARKLIDEAYEITEQKGYAEEEKAILDMHIGSYDEAREIFKKLSKDQEPFKSFAIFDLAEIEYRCKNYDEAREQYKKALCTRYRDLALIGLMSLELEVGNVCLVRQYIDEFIYDNPERLKRIFDYVIYVELYQNNIEKAKELIEQFKDLFPDSNYGRYYAYIRFYKEGITEKSYSYRIIKHISDRHLDGFKPNISIDDLYYDIKRNLKASDIPCFIPLNQNLLRVEFDDVVGTVDGEDTKVVEVAFFIDRSNIITMYPVIWYGDTIKMNQKVKEKVHKI